MSLVKKKKRHRRQFFSSLPVFNPATAPRLGTIGSPMLAFVRVCLYLPVVFLAMPFQLVFMIAFPSLAKRFPIYFHKLCCRIMGIRVEVEGQLAEEDPYLVVANHSSYLDIIVLGSLIPGSFISKKEVASWPVFNILAWLQRTIFIERKRNQVNTHTKLINRRLAQKDNLILFPEGTSTDGNRVVRFKSSLFAVTTGHDELMIQPVSIAYSKLNGISMGRMWRPFYTWYADMPLLVHILKMLSLGKAVVQVRFHPPVDPRMFDNRKDLALHCQEIVARGVAEMLQGKPMKKLSLSRDELPCAD